MKVIDPATIQQYEKILSKDPKSKIFAALADAYRELGELKRAEDVARLGMSQHPNYVGGYVALGRILCQKKEFAEAIPILQKAVAVAPENLLGYQLLGMCFIELKKPKEALKAHKMALFLNPLSERSRQAVQKLETLTADEYSADLFDTPEVTDFEVKKLAPEKSAPPVTAAQKMPVALERELSFVDALVLRNEIQKAKDLLLKLKFQGHDDPEIDHRLELISSNEEDEGHFVHTINDRRRLGIDHKITILKGLLERVETKRDQMLEASLNSTLD